jgi:two-component system sensor histidine kinase UhpB
LRHVSIALHDSSGNPLTPPRPDAEDDAHGPPAWFVSLVHPEQTAVSVPVSVKGKPGSLVITSHPNDEIAEIWDGIVTQLVVGSVVALALFFVMMTVVGRALAPLQSLAQTMGALEGGHYEARVVPGGAPELAAICTRLNHLAATLGEAVEDKRRLAERTVSLQDVERKEIARELHDEFGPYLFSLRAHASALAKLADGRAPSADAVRKHGSACWSRSTRCSSSIAACWSDCGPSALPSSACARRWNRCRGCGGSPVPRSPSRPRSRPYSDQPARWPTSPSTASCRKRSPTCSVTPARPRSTS